MCNHPRSSWVLQIHHALKGVGRARAEQKGAGRIRGKAGAGAMTGPHPHPACLRRARLSGQRGAPRCCSLPALLSPGDTSRSACAPPAPHSDQHGLACSCPAWPPPGTSHLGSLGAELMGTWQGTSPLAAAPAPQQRCLSPEQLDEAAAPRMSLTQLRLGSQEGPSVLAGSKL